MKHLKWFWISLLILLVGCGVSAETEGVTVDPHSKTDFLMGTVVTVKIYDEDKGDVLEPVFNQIEQLADELSSNEEGSVIDEINQHAGSAPIEVPKTSYDLIKEGKRYSKLADGSFDITVGPLTNLWRIGFPDARKPDQSEIDQVLPLINYQSVQLDEQGRTVFLMQDQMRLDLGSIAKGFITDQVATTLKEHDVSSAVIDLGGNIYVLGDSPQSGDTWTIGIQDPFQARGETVGVIKQKDKTVVTSGIYERNLEVDGQTCHHLLNPKTGYPYDNDIAGVSVITDSSTDGDALSTILFTKGLKDGLSFAENMSGLEAIFISRDKEIYTTSGLKGNFELTNDQFKLVEWRG